MREFRKVCSEGQGQLFVRNSHGMRFNKRAMVPASTSVLDKAVPLASERCGPGVGIGWGECFSRKILPYNFD